MATISSLSGAQSGVQSGLQQLRLQQARRNADQAEQIARSLQAQARDAEQVASDAESNARAVSGQAAQAQTNAGQARQGLAVISTISQMGSQISDALALATEKSSTPESTSPAAKQTAPVINAQGELTGTVVNTTA